MIIMLCWSAEAQELIQNDCACEQTTKAHFQQTIDDGLLDKKDKGSFLKVQIE